MTNPYIFSILLTVFILLVTNFVFRHLNFVDEPDGERKIHKKGMAFWAVVWFVLSLTGTLFVFIRNIHGIGCYSQLSTVWFISTIILVMV